MRDAELYGRGLGGKFYYCKSWMMVFDKIKSDIISGRADNFLISRKISPELAKIEASSRTRETTPQAVIA
jgi:hypothetical protein